MNKYFDKGTLRLSLLFALIFLVTGCFSSWTPSDDEAVRLLKDYYSFYKKMGIEAEIINRGDFITECKCYPIEFQIAHSTNGTYKKTFYFAKNNSGAVEIKKFKFGIKNATY